MAERIRAGKLFDGERRRKGGRLKSAVLGAIAQLGERLDRTQEVAGSSPASSMVEPGKGRGSSFRGRG